MPFPLPFPPTSTHGHHRHVKSKLSGSPTLLHRRNCRLTPSSHLKLEWLISLQHDVHKGRPRRGSKSDQSESGTLWGEGIETSRRPGGGTVGAILTGPRPLESPVPPLSNDVRANVAAPGEGSQNSPGRGWVSPARPTCRLPHVKSMGHVSRCRSFTFPPRTTNPTAK